MILMIDPPVNVFSRIEDVLAWRRELAAMRETYRGDREALRSINLADRDAIVLLELISTLPTVPSWEELIHSWMVEVSMMDAVALERFSQQIHKKYQQNDLRVLDTAMAARRREIESLGRTGPDGLIDGEPG